MSVHRRTFEASKYPKGSEERARLNLNSLTSEYMTSYRYEVHGADGEKLHSCRTKAEAVAVDEVATRLGQSR